MATFKDRIIAGRWRGRGLVLPKSESVRPTRNRVRQAAFNLLTARMAWQGTAVVDLCCGSGAWGLEAASRGAAKVVLVDSEVAVAKDNVAALGAGQVQVVKADVRAWAPGQAFDVVLADPPYGRGMAQALLARTETLGKGGSWWCVETASDEELDWNGFVDVDFRDYGVSRIWVGRLGTR